MTLDTLVQATTILANLSAFVGIPFAVWVFFHDRRRAQQERELATFQALGAEYGEFLRLCFDHPELHLYHYQDAATISLTAEQRARREIAFDHLVSILESAYFHYHQGHDTAFKRRQWTGWERYLREWVSRGDFRAAWKADLGSQFDSEFVRYVNAVMRDTERAAPASGD